MPVDDEDEPSPGELDVPPGALARDAALRDVLARDPALLTELELILPVLDPAARRVVQRSLAAAGSARRPAAVVLEALVAAARASPGHGGEDRA